MLKRRDDHFSRPPGPRQRNLHGAAGAADEFNPAVLPISEAQKQFFNQRAAFFRQLQQKADGPGASRNVILVELHKLVGGISDPSDLGGHSQTIKIQLVSVGDRSKLINAIRLGMFGQQHAMAMNDLAGWPAPKSLLRSFATTL